MKVCFLHYLTSIPVVWNGIGIVDVEEDNVEHLEPSLGDEEPYVGDQPSPDGYVCPQRRRSRRGLQEEGLLLISYLWPIPWHWETHDPTQTDISCVVWVSRGWPGRHPGRRSGASTLGVELDQIVYKVLNQRMGSSSVCFPMTLLSGGWLNRILFLPEN